jgi:uroporphyrin-III C-methyltransferase / precorrin-2 dehydrogenase / sirohydrochlorin ferrochelatase
MTGFVSLVGAGPGDPDLLTRKAARRLAEADLVLYDALVSPAALELAPRAQRFFVGKRSGRHAVSQETINALMIRAARRGRRIVRLKCGDPFLLGRGGEEALALVRAGVPFEVVPGVSSAIAAPELAGIPVTHRGLASGFVVVSGHAPSAYGPILEAIAPGSLTLVVLMGLANRGAIADLLVERGWPGATPAAILLGASTPEASTWIGSIEELAAAFLPDESRTLAGTIVIGEVVSLAGVLGEVEGQSCVADGRAVAQAGAGPRGLSPRR